MVANFTRWKSLDHLNEASSRQSGVTPMPTFRPSTDLDMHYRVDDFTDPWRPPQTILMLHGNAESGLAWYAWAPKLARHYRVVRPDMRGFGGSTAMHANIPGPSTALLRISAC
jgi:pimeloyl-ACP methyl ester carboxylesterase